ncbi:MAG: hypothetical protein ABEK17_04710, partial [Candidatus Aenigmatarchaeota archaeon]
MFNRKGQALIDDVVLVLGTLIVAFLFIQFFTNQGVQLVDYYSHLDPRISAEELSGIASAVSVAPDNFEVTYQLPKGPSDCSIYLTKNPNTFFTSLNIHTTKGEGRFQDTIKTARRSLGKCVDEEDLSEEEREDSCRCHDKEDDGDPRKCLDTNVIDTILNLIYPQCPQGPFSRIQKQFSRKWKNAMNEFSWQEVLGAIKDIPAGKCSNMVVVEDEKTGTKVLIQLKFSSMTLSVPKYSNDLFLHGSNQNLKCSEMEYPIKWRIFKEGNGIGFVKEDVSIKEEKYPGEYSELEMDTLTEFFDDIKEENNFKTFNEGSDREMFSKLVDKARDVCKGNKEREDLWVVFSSNVDRLQTPEYKEDSEEASLILKVSGEELEENFKSCKNFIVKIPGEDIIGIFNMNLRFAPFTRIQNKQVLHIIMTKDDDIDGEVTLRTENFPENYDLGNEDDRKSVLKGKKEIIKDILKEKIKEKPPEKYSDLFKETIKINDTYYYLYQI